MVDKVTAKQRAILQFVYLKGSATRDDIRRFCEIWDSNPALRMLMEDIVSYSREEVLEAISEWAARKTIEKAKNGDDRQQD